MLLLRTFGGLSVENAVFIGGAAARRRPLAVLAILAVAGRRGLSRDKLLALLWPESDPERARNSLNQALFVVRRELGADSLTLGTTELRLDPEVITSDVGEFEAAVEKEDYERAVALYAGPFLDGLFLKNAPEFERWVDGERARLQHRQAEALEHLARSATERGDRQGAVSWWRRRAALEPTSTPAATALVRALVDAGDREGAIRQAQTYAALVRSELDAEPDPALMRLAEQLRAAPASVGDAATITRQDDRPTAVVPPKSLAPAKAGAGIDGGAEELDARLRGHDDPTSPAAPAPAVTPAEAGLPSVVMPAKVGIQGPVETLESRVRGNDGPASLAAPIPVRRVRRRRLAWAAAAALGAVVIFGATYAYATRPRETPKLVIIPPFENRTGDTSLAVVGSMVADWVRQGLMQTGLVEVADARAALVESKKIDTSSGVERWRVAARRAGAGMIVRGSLDRQGDSLVVHTQVVRAADGRILYEGEPVAGSAADPRGIVEPTRQRVMGAFAALEDPRFARWQKVIVQPPRYDAYQEFLAGVESDNWGRFDSAFVHFLNAARLDTSFVQAKLRAVAASWSAADTTAAAVQEPFIAAVRAQRDRLSPYDQAFFDHVNAWQHLDRDADLIATRHMTEAAPSDLSALVAHAQAALFTNRFDEALAELHRADVSRRWVREDVDYWFRENYAHHYAGDYEGELREGARFRELGAVPKKMCGDNRDFELMALAALGREASVDSLAAGCAEGFFYLTAGHEYHAHGHRDAERRAFARAAEWYRTRHPPNKAQLVVIDWNLGNWAAVRDYWTAQMAAHPLDARGYGQLGAAAAHLGDTATARAMIQRIGEIEEHPPRFWEPLWQAIGTAALGDRARAMEFLTVAIRRGYSPAVNGHQQAGLDPLRGYPPFEALLRPRK